MMRAWVSALSCACVLACAADGRAQAQDAGLFFDDFSYATPADMPAAGWQLRDGTGHPGLPGGRFSADAISLQDDPLQPGNRVLRMTASTDGTGPGTVQASCATSASICAAPTPRASASATRRARAPPATR